jgi:putative oxidoreductase
MQSLAAMWERVASTLTRTGTWIGLLPLRLLLAWEFWEAGVMKLQGENWFNSVRADFPFPFNLVPVDISWFLATWTELLGGIGLALGLFARFWSAGLIILSVVAIAGVHWPAEWNSLPELWQGYAVSDRGFGNYKLPLLFIVMLLPLVFFGAGKVSLDHALSRWVLRREPSIGVSEAVGSAP